MGGQEKRARTGSHRLLTSIVSRAPRKTASATTTTAGTPLGPPPGQPSGAIPLTRVHAGTTATRFRPRDGRENRPAVLQTFFFTWTLFVFHTRTSFFLFYCILFSH